MDPTSEKYCNYYTLHKDMVFCPIRIVRLAPDLPVYSVKEVTVMKTRLSLLFFVLLYSAMIQTPEAREIQTSGKTAGSLSDSSQVNEAASAFLVRWRKFRDQTRDQAFEIQQTRTASGVRGTESEDFLLARLFYSPVPRKHTDLVMLNKLYFKTRN